MNGKKAKMLRRSVYNDLSTRERKYSETNIRQYKSVVDQNRMMKFMTRGFKIVQEKIGKVVKNVMLFTTSTVVSDPLRRTYQDMKRQYKAGLI